MKKNVILSLVVIVLLTSCYGTPYQSIGLIAPAISTMSGGDSKNAAFEKAIAEQRALAQLYTHNESCSEQRKKHWSHKIGQGKVYCGSSIYESFNFDSPEEEYTLDCIWNHSIPQPPWKVTTTLKTISGDIPSNTFLAVKF